MDVTMIISGAPGWSFPTVDGSIAHDNAVAMQLVNFFSAGEWLLPWPAFAIAGVAEALIPGATAAAGQRPVLMALQAAAMAPISWATFFVLYIAGHK
eukprot:SAG22_NODE_3768_length_1537_cov_1.803199_3_plen_97_part_00